MPFPGDIKPFEDKDGTKRREVRVKWWGNLTPRSTFQNLAFYYDPSEYDIPDLPAEGAQIVPKHEFQVTDTPYGIPLYPVQYLCSLAITG